MSVETEVKAVVAEVENLVHEGVQKVENLLNGKEAEVAAEATTAAKTAVTTAETTATTAVETVVAEVKAKATSIFDEFETAYESLKTKASSLLAIDKAKASGEYAKLKDEILSDASAARTKLVTIVSSL